MTAAQPETSDDGDDRSHVDVDQYRNSPPSDNQAGATLVPAYAIRKIPTFAVTEYELDGLSYQNGLTATFVSAGSALTAFAVGIVTSAAFTEKLPPAAQVLTYVGAPVLVLVSAVFFFLANWSIRNRRNSLDRIRRESRTPPALPP